MMVKQGVVSTVALQQLGGGVDSDSGAFMQRYGCAVSAWVFFTLHLQKHASEAHIPL